MAESAVKRGGMLREDWVEYKVAFEQGNGLQEWQENERRVVGGWREVWREVFM
jgi:hypothetical protein